MSPDWRFCHDCCDLGTAGAPVRRTLEVVGRGTGTSERRIAGRVEEQRLLSAAIESAASGEPSAFFVHGEAGAGKTHLVRTVCGQGARNGYAVLWGRCVRFGAVDAPYLPLGNALEGWLEAAEPDERSEVLAAVDGVGELLPSLRQQTSDKPVRLLSVLDELVQALASRRPTILVVDDIQWADPASRDALAYLIAGFRSQRLIMLATLRDEELLAGDPTHGWLADLRRLPAVHDLRLGRLTRDDTEQQLAMLIGGEPLPHPDRRRTGPHRREPLLHRTARHRPHPRRRPRPKRTAQGLATGSAGGLARTHFHHASGRTSTRGGRPTVPHRGPDNGGGRPRHRRRERDGRAG